MWAAHMEVQEPWCLASNSWLGQPASDQRDTLTVGYYCVTLHILYHTIYTLITHRIVRRLFRRKMERFSQHPPFKECYPSLSENFLVVSSPPLSHCHTLKSDYTQTQLTLIQSVESILELGKHWVFAKISQRGLAMQLGCIARSRKLMKTRLREVY